MTAASAPIRRRALLAAGGALLAAACGRASHGQDEPPADAPAPPTPAMPPLRSVAPFPIGCAIDSSRLTDPAYAAFLTQEVSQVTAEWEMKMEYILQDDGALRFDAPDAIAGFARRNALRLFGHNLIWYAQVPVAFERLDGQAAAFAAAYRRYILDVAGRYHGQAVGWDVVNEAVAEDGEGLRSCLWSRNLGELDYIRRAFDHAREADPEAVLFINDYNLESLPRKREAFLRLVERLLQAGAPLGGLGTQSHLTADLDPAAPGQALQELARFGLPIHVSELDISLNGARSGFSRAELVMRQQRLAQALAAAFTDLPERQRFAFTLWGLRGVDSWLRDPKENPSPPWDQPSPFDDHGRPRPMLAGLEAGFRA
ncbi:MAG: endo-1,4-beta-xylanase [Caulobacteraceae bacterium]|nr:endo-1,4-beta-xylanase [Caulobacteraceae bacterium]